MLVVHIFISKLYPLRSHLLAHILFEFSFPIGVDVRSNFPGDEFRTPTTTTSYLLFSASILSCYSPTVSQTSFSSSLPPACLRCPFSLLAGTGAPPSKASKRSGGLSRAHVRKIVHSQHISHFGIFCVHCVSFFAFLPVFPPWSVEVEKEGGCIKRACTNNTWCSSQTRKPSRTRKRK